IVLLPLATLFPYTTLFRSCREATDNHFRLVFFGLFFQIGVVDMTGSIDTVRNDVVQFTGEVNRRTVSQVTAMRQVHTQNGITWRSEEHTSELQSRFDLVCR